MSRENFKLAITRSVCFFRITMYIPCRFQEGVYYYVLIKGQLLSPKCIIMASLVKKPRQNKIAIGDL